MSDCIRMKRTLSVDALRPVALMNRISASISGAFARFTLPCGMAVG